MKRGDIVVAQFPHVVGSPPKVRPVLVVQDDYYNQRIGNVLVASITGNLKRRGDRAHLLIEISTAEGQQTGLSRDSLISCLNLAVLRKTDLGRKIGELTKQLLQNVDDCLKAALGIP